MFRMVRIYFKNLADVICKIVGFCRRWDEKRQQFVDDLDLFRRMVYL